MLARFATARTVSSPTEAASRSAVAVSRISRRVRSLWRSARLNVRAVDIWYVYVSYSMTSEGGRQMGKQSVVVRRGEGEALNVMGAGVRFVCPSENTGKGWSMMEVTVPRHAGPPSHHHPWDEAYYVVEGEVRFGIDGREVLVKGG